VNDVLPALAAGVVVAAALVLWLVRQRRDLGTPAERATYTTLHTASLAAPPLRAGLTEAAASRAIRHLRALLDAPATAITSHDRLLAWDGVAGQHAESAVQLAGDVLADGSTQVYGPSTVSCQVPDCPLRHAVVAPLTVEDRVVGLVTPPRAGGRGSCAADASPYWHALRADCLPQPMGSHFDLLRADVLGRSPVSHRYQDTRCGA